MDKLVLAITAVKLIKNRLLKSSGINIRSNDFKDNQIIVKIIIMVKIGSVLINSDANVFTKYMYNFCRNYHHTECIFRFYNKKSDYIYV